MSGGWEAGDLALCIKGGRVTRVGSVYQVVEVRAAGEKCGCGSRLWLDGVALLFVGHVEPDERGCEPWASSVRFRKITLPAADEFDREVIALMNGTPVPVEA